MIVYLLWISGSKCFINRFMPVLCTTFRLISFSNNYRIPLVIFFDSKYFVIVCSVNDFICFFRRRRGSSKRGYLIRMMIIILRISRCRWMTMMGANNSQQVSWVCRWFIPVLNYVKCTTKKMSLMCRWPFSFNTQIALKYLFTQLIALKVQKYSDLWKLFQILWLL